MRPSARPARGGRHPVSTFSRSAARAPLCGSRTTNFCKYSSSHNVNEQMNTAGARSRLVCKRLFRSANIQCGKFLLGALRHKIWVEGWLEKGPVSDVRRGVPVVGKATLDAVNPCG